MNSEITSSTQQLEDILQEIEALSPTRDQTRGTEIDYRKLENGDGINDTLEGELSEDESEISIHESRQRPPEDLPEAVEFEDSCNVPVAAVDCGIIRLGETRNGLVIALRASIAIDDNGILFTKSFKTGPLYLLNDHKKDLFYKIGQHLHKPDIFVEIDNSDPANPVPTVLKSGVADNSHQFGDRFRNWLERLVQMYATSTINNGVILLDGALTFRTRDTPQVFLERLAEHASNNNNAIIAISKQSMLQISGKSIQFWLDDVPEQPRYRLLTNLLRAENRERFLGNVYSARFSSLGPTFRMDVKAVRGQSDAEAINQFYNSVLMRCGYPDILVRAHVHSYFTLPDVIQLQALAGAKYRFRPIKEFDLRGIFAPFGGRFK